jgi:hypothetical protein
MEAHAISDADVETARGLDALLLDAEGRLKPLEASVLRQIRQPVLSTWCQMRGRYHVPSVETIHWLSEKIAGRRAIEIGAGAGDLGRLLHIPMTDSYIQMESPEILLYYATLGVPPTKPPADVERLEALEAVKKYAPEVVVGAWITQLYRKGDEGPPFVGSSIYGVNELELRNEVETYIHIGHAKTHHQKRALRFKHKEYRLPFLFSRQMDPAGNVIYVWSRKQ